MLHIHNGDSAAGTARKSDIPGEHMAWREALVCGPAPDGLSETEFWRIRAQHLADAYGVSRSDAEQQLRNQHETLTRISKDDEVVLWFEHDLFCQVQLIYLLHWFASHDRGPTRLSLVSIGEFSGFPEFRGLGQLNEEQLASLFPKRREVSTAQLEFGSRAWSAYSSSNPKHIETLLESDPVTLPFLKTALIKHLQRFPTTTNGLGRVENAGLELVSNGFRNFKSLFPAFTRREPEYGFGDSQLYYELKRLVDTTPPLLTSSITTGPTPRNPAQLFLSSFEITEHGKAVLAEEQDFVRTNGIDQWLGGVHLKGREADWRWDELSGELLVRL
jgi:hypothetical protein